MWVDKVGLADIIVEEFCERKAEMKYKVGDVVWIVGFADKDSTWIEQITVLNTRQVVDCFSDGRDPNFYTYVCYQKPTGYPRVEESGEIFETWEDAREAWEKARYGELGDGVCQVTA